MTVLILHSLRRELTYLLVIYRSWLCHHARRPTNSIRLTGTDQNAAEVRTNWKRDTGSRVRVRKVPSVCVWSNCRDPCTDHRPLQSIFNKTLHQAPARLQRFLLQLQKYDLQVTYKPGKYVYVADTPSRSYLQETKEQLVSETEIMRSTPSRIYPSHQKSTHSSNEKRLKTWNWKPWAVWFSKYGPTNEKMYLQLSDSTGLTEMKSPVWTVCCSREIRS